MGSGRLSGILRGRARAPVPRRGAAPCWDVSPGCAEPTPSPLCVAVRSVKNKPAFFADKLYKSMKVRAGSHTEGGGYRAFGAPS